MVNRDVQEIKLYGVNHGVSMSTIFGTKQHFDVAPPDGFLEHFQIGPETLVGIETTAGMAKYVRRYEEEDFRHMNLRYGLFFPLACEALRAANVPIAFLDDVRLTRHVLPDVADKFEKINSKYVRSDDFLSRRDENRRGFFGSLANWINILREPILYRNMANVRPDVVVIGRAHADVLAADEKLQRQYGIAVIDYAHIEPEFDAGVSPYRQPVARGFERHDNVLPSSIHVPTSHEINELANMHRLTAEQMRRSFNAFSIGRVLGRHEPAPAYLGRFSIADSAAYSLFEVAMLERQGTGFKAVIHDLLGDASVEGERQGALIEFEKTYTTFFGGQYLPKWIYRGRVDEETGIITGRYDIDYDSARYGNCFVMAPFSEPPRRSTIKTLDNRSAWSSRDSDVFKIDWPPLDS